MGFTNFVYNDSVGGCGLNNFAVNTGWNPQGGFALT